MHWKRALINGRYNTWRVPLRYAGRVVDEHGPTLDQAAWRTRVAKAALGP